MYWAGKVKLSTSVDRGAAVGRQVAGVRFGRTTDGDNKGYND